MAHFNIFNNLSIYILFIYNICRTNLPIQTESYIKLEYKDQKCPFKNKIINDVLYNQKCCDFENIFLNAVFCQISNVNSVGVINEVECV